jgi:hypothetical protein
MPAEVDVWVGAQAASVAAASAAVSRQTNRMGRIIAHLAN